jgi:Protein of unknown function (DUF2786)
MSPLKIGQSQAKIIAKIRALLAKTVENGCTAEEADAALAKARKLMAKHKITEDQLRDHPPEKATGRPEPPPRTAHIDEFYAFGPENKFFYTPTRTLWPKASVLSRLGADAITYLERKRDCQCMTWCPGKPMIVEDHIVMNEEWVYAEGKRTFNNYIPPKPIAGDADKAGPWRQLVERLWGDGADRVERYLAWKVQKPHIKINHGLVLGSRMQGIGKDSFMRPVRRAIGPWNFEDIAARQTLDPAHNSFLEAVIVRINEAHDLGADRFKFYDISKPWQAAPPEVLSVADKWIVRHPMFNCVNAIIGEPQNRRHVPAAGGPPARCALV